MFFRKYRNIVSPSSEIKTSRQDSKETRAKLRRAFGPAIENPEERTLMSFTAPVTYTSGGATPLGMTVADFNKDGNADLAIANAGAGNTISVFLGNGDGTFQAKKDYAAGANPFRVKSADVN